MPDHANNGCARCGAYAPSTGANGEPLCTAHARAERRILAAAATARQIESERERRAAWKGCH